MGTPVRASDQDLRALAAIVSHDRPDLPVGEGLLPPSLLADLMGQIRCDGISLERYDSRRQVHRWLQGDDEDDDAGLSEDWHRVFWTHYWDCLLCSYPVRTGDLRGVVKVSDFYSARQWHSSGMYIDCIRPQGLEHHLMLGLPELPEMAGPGRHARLVLHRGPGPDFSERDRALLVLLRPHLYQACLDVERHRHPVPRLTSRQNDAAASGRGRAHQHPDRPSSRYLRGNGGHPPGKHLRKAGCLQPHRCGHLRPRGSCRLGIGDKTSVTCPGVPRPSSLARYPLRGGAESRFGESRSRSDVRRAT